MHVQSWNIYGGGFHFGEQGLGQEETSVVFHSDSLFAALIAALAESEGRAAVETFIQPFLAGSPPFLITSTFPIAGEVRFFPRPELRGGQAENAPAAISSKKLKKVCFLSQGAFSDLISGAALSDIYQRGCLLQDGLALINQSERSRLPKGIVENDAQIWQREQRPRVTLGRAAQISAIYFTGRVSFAKDCGLWFGVRWLADNPRVQSLLARLLEQLSISGLGAERNSGFGNCQIEPGQELELPAPSSASWTTLSRYLPREDETGCLGAPGAAYTLKRVGGWLSSPVRNGQRRRTLNLLAEGSIFGPLERESPGQILDVRPRYATDLDPLGHPVYRSGLAFPVGLGLPGEKEGRL